MESSAYFNRKENEMSKVPRIGRLLGLLGVIFIILKLCSVITWPWVVVCIPFIVWGVFILGAVLFVIIGVILIGLGTLVEETHLH